MATGKAKNEKPVVLVVDDTPDNIMLVNEVLKDTYKVKVATNGKTALEITRKTLPDIILMDVMMPVMNGYEACRQLKKDKKFEDIPLIFVTAKSDEENEKKGLALGAADFIIKPINPSILKARIRTHLALKRSRDILKNQNQYLDKEVQRRIKDITIMQEATIMAMAALAETRDNDTGRHLRRTRFYIQELAEHMAKIEKYKNTLTPEKIHLIALSSPLHDIGKVGIPDDILLKPGPLTAEEFEVIKTHTTLGRDAILTAENLIGGAETFLTCARKIAYSHHEKWDGTGYPLGLSGENIPLPARLMAVVDAYDALTSKRVYKEAVTHNEAVSIIKADSGKHFDPDVVDAFLELQEEFKQISRKYTDSNLK